MDGETGDWHGRKIDTSDFGGIDSQSPPPLIKSFANPVVPTERIRTLTFHQENNCGGSCPNSSLCFNDRIYARDSRNRIFLDVVRWSWPFAFPFSALSFG